MIYSAMRWQVKSWVKKVGSNLKKAMKIIFGNLGSVEK